MKYMVLSLSMMLVGCGGYYGDKSTCDSKFSDTQTKVDKITPNTSTKDQLMTVMGNPDKIYATKNNDINDYSYLVYAKDNFGGYCGQYRISVNEQSKLVMTIQPSKEYLVN